MLGNAMTRLRHWWLSLTILIRASWIILWAFGVALFVLGIRGDTNGWWDNRSFLANVVSSLTTACFGVPLALVFFQRLSDQQADRSAKRITISTGRRAAENLARTGSSLYARDLESLRAIRQTTLSCMIRLAHKESFYRVPSNRNEYPDQEELDNNLRELADVWNQCAFDSNALLDILIDLRNQNNFLVERLRYEFARSQIRWMSARAERAHTEALENLTGATRNIPGNVIHTDSGALIANNRQSFEGHVVLVGGFLKYLEDYLLAVRKVRQELIASLPT